MAAQPSPRPSCPCARAPTGLVRKRARERERAADGPQLRDEYAVRLDSRDHMEVSLLSQIFEVSNAAAMETYSKKQEELAASGLAEPLDHFSDSIEVWLLVRLSEPKASGSCELNDDGDLEKRWEFKYSLDAKPKPVESLDPEGLAKGDRFRLTKATPLMPAPNPADPKAALEQVVNLVAGSLVEVKGSREVKGSKWYEVEVEKKSGWLNSTALIGQKLRRIK